MIWGIRVQPIVPGDLKRGISVKNNLENPMPYRLNTNRLIVIQHIFL